MQLGAQREEARFEFIVSHVLCELWPVRFHSCTRALVPMDSCVVEVLTAKLPAQVVGDHQCSEPDKFCKFSRHIAVQGCLTTLGL